MKVVDTQVMLHRVTEYAKDTSIQQKRGDVAQQLLKDQSKQEVARKAAEVEATSEQKAQQAINRDGGGSSGGFDKKKNKKKDNDNDDMILDGRNPLLADMSFETENYQVPKPRIDIDI